MKTFFRFSVALILAAILVACGGGTAEPSAETDRPSLASAMRRVLSTSSTSINLLTWPVNFQPKYGYEWLQDTGTAYGCAAGEVFHPGADINKRGTVRDEDKGEPLYAVADGEIVFADDTNWASLIIRFSFAGEYYYAVYGHSEINSGSPEVKAYELQRGKTFETFTTPRVGMRVTRGQVVGLLWNHNTTYAHLHFEIRSSKHPSPTDGTGFCQYYGGKSKSQISNSNRDPFGFILTHGYIDSTCRLLDPNEAIGIFCWTSNPIGDYVACEKGFNHVNFNVKADRWLWIISGMNQRTINSRCAHLSQNMVDLRSYLGRVDTVVGGDEGGWQGAGYILGSTDEPALESPDFVVTKVWMETRSGVEIHKVGMKESFNTKAQAANIGDGPCKHGEGSTIVGHFYLSKGYKEDPHSGSGAWRRIDSTTTACDNLKPGNTNTETKNTKVSDWITEPGIYNIVYCIDHPKDDHNNGGDHKEKHKSNNCSTEAVFEVTADAVVNIPDTDLVVSAVEVKGSSTQLPAGGVTNLRMAIRNIGTVTAIANFRSSYSFCGPLPSTACVQVADDGSDAGELTPGRDQWEETKAPVRVPTLLGSYLLRVCADYLGNVPETDKTNNCRTTPVQVVTARPDFIITALGLREGSSIRKGSRVHPWCTVTNIGTGPSPSGMKLAYYINEGQFRDDDTVDATEMCTGCSKTEEVLNNDIKLGDKGTRTLRCCADYLGQVSEINEGNNCATMSFTVR